MSELELFKLFCILFWCHTLLDYALQGDFMSRAKNPFPPPGQATYPFPGVPPFLILFQHAFLQAGPLLYISQARGRLAFANSWHTTLSTTRNAPTVFRSGPIKFCTRFARSSGLL